MKIEKRMRKGCKVSERRVHFEKHCVVDLPVERTQETLPQERRRKVHKKKLQCTKKRSCMEN
ncbi:unnamed protein product [Acanthoscelides obtectus]|uniref:Uncharacterized protein n=1 Tax=Acanthoscelides obtectus TaxID=200917 RepID=A0A9P0MIA7_ACAOB|nr:unnamed protein product [Acanthoscelides obtectus]CAK1627242.1 hypothetical protein AOBTE_LOCUS4425 [Acanthoscelides obtectus]